MEITFDGGKIITAHLNGNKIRTDQPLDNGGTNTAPAPFDLFLASIGTCAGIYIKSFCDRRDLPTDGIRIIQTMEIDSEKRLPSVFRLEIILPSDFPDKYRDAVINAADLCLVKKTIANNPQFIITTKKL
ncbi:MAG: osmotically inducible protein OsmC [Bacteroidales bacterium]|nr:osmotically inducible protein OsmC [Bacteroidales bacterium]